jgi:hypothetical protein
MYRRELLLNMRRWAVEDYIEVLPRIKATELQDFYRRLMSRCGIQ